MATQTEITKIIQEYTLSNKRPCPMKHILLTLGLQGEDVASAKDFIESLKRKGVYSSKRGRTGGLIVLEQSEKAEAAAENRFADNNPRQIEVDVQESKKEVEEIEETTEDEDQLMF